jgi:hypothetical protein
MYYAYNNQNEAAKFLFRMNIMVYVNWGCQMGHCINFKAFFYGIVASLRGNTMDGQDVLDNFVPKTGLGKRLLDLRNRAIASGIRLLSEDEVLEEVRRRRGEIEDKAALYLLHDKTKCCMISFIGAVAKNKSKRGGEKKWVEKERC